MNGRLRLIRWGQTGKSAHLVAFHLPDGKAIPACSHKTRLPYDDPPEGAPMCDWCAAKAREYVAALGEHAARR
jgi:hypothetical protein